MTIRHFIIFGALLLLGVSLGWGQRRFGGRYGNGPVTHTEGGEPVDELTVKTAREIASHSSGTPVWTNDAAFSQGTFTFVRIIRDRNPEDSPTAGNWITDYPDSDLNLSYRVQQMTSIRTDPDCRILRLTDTNLFDFPWIYMVEPGALRLRDEEVVSLRKYLLKGGFLMADDFWGEWHWKAFRREMKRVFPDREFVELPMEHPIFHCVFDLKVPKNKLQTPNIGMVRRSRSDFVTWETHPREGSYSRWGPGAEECSEMHVRALLDDRGRIMVIATHNCDNGDGWEREGEDDFFFHEFSEKRAFPLGINIIFYAMTH